VLVLAIELLSSTEFASPTDRQTASSALGTLSAAVGGN
jgi:hypothetical protein